MTSFSFTPTTATQTLAVTGTTRRNVGFGRAVLQPPQRLAPDPIRGAGGSVCPHPPAERQMHQHCPHSILARQRSWQLLGTVTNFEEAVPHLGKFST